MSEFADYCFCSDWDGNGEIFNSEGKVVWRFRSVGSDRNEGTPLFVFSGPDGKELAVVRREKRLLMARFAVFENDVRMCTIWQRTLTLTKYDFEFSQVKWTLRMPMFSVRMRAASENGLEILVHVRSRKQWFVRLPIGNDQPPMMAALAYITRKKLQCT